jgi:SAM-dependent methyltransferase
MDDPKRTFDEYATGYDLALDQGISISGEDKNYFARRRVEWLRRCLQEISAPLKTVMDYGCGTGTSAPFLFNLLELDFLIGTDASIASIDIARQKHGSNALQFVLFDQYEPSGRLDLVFCNGVFHHIRPSERAATVDYVFRSLRPGGIFAFWENNPWNPGTRYVMSRIPFDRDAITVSAIEARGLLRAGGFEVIRTDFLFIFPKFLSWLRFMEPIYSRLPLGAQYQVLCRRPTTPA